MPVLDLKKPGKFWVQAENEETCTFHLVKSNPKYTKDSLSKNPAVDKNDQLMNPYTVPAAQAQDGKIIFDVAKRAQEIGQNVKARMAKGEAIGKVQSIAIVFAKKGNKIPPKQLAEVAEYDLLGFPAVFLKPIKNLVTVQQFKAGQKVFTAELTTSGRLGKVILTSAPPVEIICKTTGEKGTGTATITVEPGKKYAMEFGVHLKQRIEPRQMKVPPAYQRYVPGGWRTRGAKLVYDARVKAWVVPDNQLHLVLQSERRHTRTDNREIWTGGPMTITAKGTEDPNAKASAAFKAESWASGWLIGRPPAVFRHNVC